MARGDAPAEPPAGPALVGEDQRGKIAATMAMSRRVECPDAALSIVRLLAAPRLETITLG